MELTASVIAGFVGSVLAPRFDEPSPSPKWHHEAWELCCSPHPRIAIASPRAHAKTSAITIGYGLSALLFRQRRHLLIISDTEGQANQFLGGLKNELANNEILIELFGLKRRQNGEVDFIVDNESELICEFADGHRFRIIAKGAEQKMRGSLWDGLRPDLVICHEKNTRVYTEETGWILNQDYPKAKEIYTHVAYKVTFEDGHTETVSSDHRFYVEGYGWKYVWELKNNDQIVENGMPLMPPSIPIGKKLVQGLTTINQKLKQKLLNGVRPMLIETLLPAENGMKRIKKLFMLRLLISLDKILNGKLLTVLKDVQENSEPVLLGLQKNTLTRLGNFINKLKLKNKKLGYLGM